MSVGESVFVFARYKVFDFGVGELRTTFYTHEPAGAFSAG
jgi:hypothetical protein